MTLAEKAYHSLRNDIVRGDIQPGSALKMADLSARYDMGFSPLREALSRLQGERLVTSESLRGFRVSDLSLAEFEDALQTRLVIETEALRLSMRHGDDAWAAQVVAATYALKLQAQRQTAGSDRWELETRHHTFHRSLLAACGSRWMLDFFEQLYMATDRYRLPILMSGTGRSGRDPVAEHAALADAALARDADLATGLLVQHYQSTADTIRATLSGNPKAPALRRSGQA